jgi:hypothetical protein
VTNGGLSGPASTPRLTYVAMAERKGGIYDLVDLPSVRRDGSRRPVEVTYRVVVWREPDDSSRPVTRRHCACAMMLGTSGAGKSWELPRHVNNDLRRRSQCICITLA